MNTAERSLLFTLSLPDGADPRITLPATPSAAVTVTDDETGTVVTVPGAPQDFAVSAGDAQVVLTWTAPASDGGAAITEYEYRHSTGSTVSSSATWTDVTDGSDAGASTADELGVTVGSLTNGTGYAFEVRAVNGAGGGTATTTKTATPSATSCAMPYFGDRRNIWTGAVTVEAHIHVMTFLAYGFVQNAHGGLDDKTFSIGSNPYEIDEVKVSARGPSVGDHADQPEGLRPDECGEGRAAAARLQCDLRLQRGAPEPRLSNIPTRLGPTTSTGLRSAAARST